MLSSEAVSFEKLAGVVTVLVTLTLLACGAFYLRRRIGNLECALKDQAKVTQNVLQMMSTMMPRVDDPEMPPNPMSSIFDTFASEHHVIAVGGWMPDMHNTAPREDYEKIVDVTDDGKESSELIVVSDVEDEEPDNTPKVVTPQVATAQDQEVSVKEDVQEYIQEHTKDETKEALVNYDKMKVDELRDLIEKRGLPAPGKNKLKKELIQILEA